MQFSDIAATAAADHVITADEILALRAVGWADGKMDPEEAETLFVANDNIDQPSAEWCDFFVEALSEFVVNTVEPHGYVDQEMGDELIARIDHDGRVDTVAELELLVRVLEKSLSVPQAVKAYALKQIEDAVLAGEGPTRHGELAHGINATEALLLRRTIFSAGGDRPAAVSKAEAEMLFRIKDATLYDKNAAEWDKLFVQGVANFLLGFGGKDPLSRERAGELETFMNSEGSGIGGFLGRMMTSKPDFDGAFGSLLDLTEVADDEGEGVEDASGLSDGEASWLQDMLEADEELDELEKALIAFIDEETGGQFVPRAQG
jgi:hypothetical protein